MLIRLSRTPTSGSILSICTNVERSWLSTYLNETICRSRARCRSFSGCFRMRPHARLTLSGRDGVTVSCAPTVIRPANLTDTALDLVFFAVISICSPTPCHAHDLEIALRLKPKLIFCEKPVTTSLAETERLVEECCKSNILLAVDYSRRFDPDVSKLRNDMQAGKWGRLRSVVGYYNKGILNNGSHMLDLLHLLVGPMDIVRVGKPVYDFSAGDPTVPVWLEGRDDLPVHLVCGHAEDFAIFELQLVFLQGVLTMEEGGMVWRERARIC